jgi:hypothetical protein
MKRTAVLGLVAAALLGAACDDDDGQIPTITIINTQTIHPGQNGGPFPSPIPSPGAVARVTLGCFGMQDPNGLVLPECGAGLETYFAPAGSKGTLDATPLDAQGGKVHNLSVEAWFYSGACVLTGETSGPDGFNPTIQINAGNCVVTVRVAGVVGGPRLFVGQ